MTEMVYLVTEETHVVRHGRGERHIRHTSAIKFVSTDLETACQYYLKIRKGRELGPRDAARLHSRSERLGKQWAVLAIPMDKSISVLATPVLNVYDFFRR